jgi:hypothetical protein
METEGLESIEIMQMKEKNKELSLALKQFLKIIYIDFGIKDVNKKMQEWYKLNWDEFHKELAKHQVRFTDCLLNDWKEFFDNHKKKVLSFME